MQEGDAPPVSALTGRFVDEPVAGTATRIEGTVEVGDPVADVVNARSATREKPSDRTVGAVWLQKLHLNVAECQADDRRAVDPFRRAGDEAEDVTIERKSGRDAGHRDRDMSDTHGWVGHTPAT